MDYDDDFLMKAELKRIALDLEKKNLVKSIMFYEKLLTNRLFLNDYYPYKRLVLLYGMIKDYRSRYEIAKSFFTSNIYCSKRYCLFFRNTLYESIKRKFTTEDEVNGLLEYYKNNGLKNKEKSNYPAIIADRINISEEIPSIMPEDRYDWYQESSEWREIARGYRILGKYCQSIETYEKMIYELPYYSYKYYGALYSLYKEIGDYKNARRIVNEYLEFGYKRSDGGLDEFKKYKKEISRLIHGNPKSNSSALSIVFPDEKESLEDSDIDLNNQNDSENISADEEDFFDEDNVPDYDKVSDEDFFDESEFLSELIDYDVNDAYSLTTRLCDKYKADINEKLIFYEYDERLSKKENIQRKYYLKRYADELMFKGRYGNYIELLEKLKDNSYFKNDWYPYKHLCISYDKRNNFKATLKNIKELVSRGIWLNDYHYDFFYFNLKNLEKQVCIDEEDILAYRDYYNNHGALNKHKSDMPTVLADKMKMLSRDTLGIYTEENFESIQEEYGFKQFGLLFETNMDYESAAQYYIDVLNEGVNRFEIYKRLVYCLDILDNYELILEVLKLFYRSNNMGRKYRKNRKFVKDNLDLVNSNLGTKYEMGDLE